MRLIIMEMEMKMKNRSYRYDIDKPNSRYGHKHSKYKKFLTLLSNVAYFHIRNPPNTVLQVNKLHEFHK